MSKDTVLRSTATSLNTHWKRSSGKKSLWKYIKTFHFLQWTKTLQSLNKPRFRHITFCVEKAGKSLTISKVHEH